MWLWWFWLICDLLIPFVMIVVGRMSWKHCPKNINSLIGYRTTRSMKSMDTWKFAHEYCGKLWWKLGWLIMILTALMHVLIISIYPTEKALKEHFNDDGTRK